VLTALILLFAACPDHSTVLEIAIRESNAELVSSLIVRGARVNPLLGGFGTSNRTPLELAILFGDLKTVELLLAAGADVHAPTSTGLSPMMLAFHRGRRDVGRLLVRHGAKTLSAELRPNVPDIQDSNRQKATIGISPAGSFIQDLAFPGTTAGLTLPDPVDADPW
jgi:ankyrin repeat protein